MAEVSAAASVSAAQPPSPEATAPPSYPSRWLRGCWTWKREEGAFQIGTLEGSTITGEHHPCRSGLHTYGQ